MSAKVRFVGIDPVYKVLTIKNYYTDTQDLAKFTLVYKGDTISLGKLNLISGSLKCPPKFFAFFSVPDIDYDSGSFGMYDNRYGSQINPSNFCDFAQWGRAGQPYEYLADSMKFWKKGDYINGNLSAFNFTGGSTDRNVTYWTAFKKPLLGLRIVYIKPYKQQIGIKNTGNSNVDISNLYIANDTGCSDSISRMPFAVLKGKLNLLKNDTIILGGFYMGDTVGSAALFFNINRYDTVNLLDYVKWGRGHSRFAYLAQQKNIWDTTQFITIKSNDSFHYIGNFTKLQTGAAFWEVYKVDTGHVDTTDTTSIQSYYISPEKISIQNINNVLNITNNTVEKMNMELIDQSGKILTTHAVQMGLNEYNIANLPQGIYYILVQKDGWKMVDKIMIND